MDLVDLNKYRRDFAKLPNSIKFFSMSNSELSIHLEETRKIRMNVSACNPSAEREDLIFDISSYMSDIREVLDRRKFRSRPEEFWND